MNHAEIKRRQAQAISAVLALLTMAAIAGLTGYNGVTYVAVAMETYAFFYMAVSGGVSDALGRLLRLRKSKGQYKNAHRMRRNVMLFQLVLGALGTILILAAAEEIAEKIFGMQYSTVILMIFAPAVFLRSVSAVLLGYCRGEGSELPTAAVGILRQVFTLGFSFMFCKILGNYGKKVSLLLVNENFTSMYGGVGVAISVTLTELFVVIFLLLVYKGSRRTGKESSQEGMRAASSFTDCISALCAGRGAQAGIQLLAMLSLPIGLIFFRKAAADSEAAAVEYGVYAAGYGVVCGVLVALVLLLAIPVCGKSVLLLRKEEHRFARTVYQSGVHIIVVHTAFMAAFVSVMAKQIAAVVCPEQAGAEKMFRGGSLAVIFVALAFYFSRMLLLTGKKYLVMGAAAVADVIYAVSVAIFVNAGKAGILSLVYAGVMGSAALCIILGALTYRQLRVKADWLQILVVPVGAACVSGLVSMLLGRVFTPHLGNFFALLVCLVPAAILYWVGLLLLRNFREQELEAIPGGKLINAAGQMLHVF